MPANPSDKSNSDTSVSGLGTQISGATARVKDKATELGQSAADTLDSQRGTQPAACRARPRRFARALTSCQEATR